MNRFKGLDLVNKLPEELWTEVHNTVQESLPKKKKYKKTKWLSKKVLQIAEERREAKNEKGKDIPN